MSGTDRLNDCVRELLARSASLARRRGVGVIRTESDGTATLTYADALGASAYRVPLADVPDALNPALQGIGTLSATAFETAPPSLIGSRLFYTGVPQALKDEHGADSAVALPVASPSGAARLIVGMHAVADPDDREMALIDGLIPVVASFLQAVEAPEEQVELLRRFEATASLLPALIGVLDIREIFQRVSSMTRPALAHDFASLGIFDADLTRAQLYAESQPNLDVGEQEFSPYLAVQTRGWLYRIVDDLAQHPLERTRQIAKAGGRTSLRVAVRLDDRVLGSLTFASRSLTPYSWSDLAVAQRVAQFVALALSHHQLAEDRRRSAELRARAENLEMLDGLLDAISGVLDIREVFERVSEIAQKVLPHDALSIAEIIDEGRRVRMHAARGLLREAPFEAETGTRQLLRYAREHKIIDDLAARPDYSTSPGLHAGMRSMLVSSIRVEGRHYGGLSFYSRTPGHFTQDDALVAARIADHVSLALSHQRLADQARLTEELKAKAAALEMVDHVLTSLTEEGDLPETFDRISAAVQQVLPHDALLLALRTSSDGQASVYARTSNSQFSGVVRVPPEVVAVVEWDFQVVDDLLESDPQQLLPSTRQGYRSVLRLPISVDDQLVAGLSFFSREPNKYQAGDVPTAKRIRDRIALRFARERGASLLKQAGEASERASRLESRVRALTDELESRAGYRRIVGQSASWQVALTQATQVAPTEATALLLGESGTGKEVLARFIHYGSARKSGPFIALNCAALPETLLEAELFGYERGAYTGATQNKPGQLEQAAGGTLFLDEVGEMSLSAQAKFLRVLQEREFQRLGGTRVLKADARVVAATNRDLRKAITQGQFREDLFYRLNVFAIRLPPLRERPDDILPLAEAFLSEVGRGLGRPPSGISRDARQRLAEYHWPGNVRELRNVLERAAILCEGGLITSSHLALDFYPQEPAPVVPAPAGGRPVGDGGAQSSPAGSADLQSVERQMIEEAMRAARYNKSKAAKTLGLTRQQLYVRLRRYGLD